MRMATVLAGASLLASCAAPPERELSVGMVDYGFLPSRIEVATGERVRFLIRNAGLQEHDFGAGERGRAFGLGHVHLRPGASGMTDWTAPATASSLRIVCTVAGHEQLGMVAELVIVERPRASAAPTR